MTWFQCKLDNANASLWIANGDPKVDLDCFPNTLLLSSDDIKQLRDQGYTIGGPGSKDPGYPDVVQTTEPLDAER